MWKYNDWVTAIPPVYLENEVKKVLDRCMVCENAHVQYPADNNGAHLSRFFGVEALRNNSTILYEIALRLAVWIKRERIEYDKIFASNHRPVTDIVEMLLVRDTIEKRKTAALWEYLPTGRFGDKLVSGEIKPGDRVLVYNAVSIQGRCIGERLPSFAEALGGEVVAIACFAKGTTPKVRELEEKWGNKFYSAIQVDIPVYKPEDCPMCKAGEKLIPWTEL